MLLMCWGLHMLAVMRALPGFSGGQRMAVQLHRLGRCMCKVAQQGQASTAELGTEQRLLCQTEHTSLEDRNGEAL